jgi:hypothetical protein
MSITSGIYNVLQQQATLDQTRATTQDTQALAQMRGLALVLQQQQAQRNQMMAERLQQSPSFNNPTGPGTPGAGNPPAPVQPNIMGMDFAPDDPLMESLRNAREGVNLTAQRVQMAHDVGDVAAWQKATQDHDNQQKEYRLATLDVIKEGERRNKETSQVFGGVETAADLKAALQYVNNNVSKVQAQKITAQIARTIPNIDTATPEEIQAAVAPISNRYATAGDQLRFRGSMQASEDRAAALEQRKVEATDRAARAQAGVGETLTGDPLDLAAEKYLANGTLPPLYRDAASKKAVIARAAELQKERGGTMADVPAQQAEFRSNSGALSAITKDLATIRPYKDMLDTNAEILKSLAHQAIATGSPFINKPINWIEQNAAGDPKMAEFLAQMHFVQTEAARVISNPRLVGQMTDTAKQELNAVLNGTMSLSQVESVVNRIQNDGFNRVNAMENERRALVNSMKKGSGGAAEKSATAPNASAAAPTGIPVPSRNQLKNDGTTIYNTARGPAKWNGSAFVPQ